MMKKKSSELSNRLDNEINSIKNEIYNISLDQRVRISLKCPDFVNFEAVRKNSQIIFSLFHLKKTLNSLKKYLKRSEIEKSQQNFG